VMRVAMLLVMRVSMLLVMRVAMLFRRYSSIQSNFLFFILNRGTQTHSNIIPFSPF
jgi:hypothetical protein